MTKKLAFDPAAARKVLQVAKTKQLPRAAVEALYGAPPSWGLGKLPFIGAVHPKGMGSQHAQVLRGAPSGALLQSAPAFNVMRTGILEQGHATSAIPSLQGPHKKMLEAVVKGHELAELQSPLGASMLALGHNSPEVMLREHNMVTTLPAEHAPVKEFLGLARKSREAKMLAQYGVDYGESPRLSRHARKHIAAMMESDISKPVRPKLAEVITELKPHQQRVVDRIMKQPGLVVAHGMGSGKAQPLYAKVLTPIGWTTMGELQVGDLVIGANGHPTEVLGVFPQGELDVFQVVMSDGSTTTCCDDHLWQVNTAKRVMRGASSRVLPLRVLKERLSDKHGNRQHFVPMVHPVHFKERELALHPYVLGVLLGDGSLVTGTPSLSSADKELVSRVQSLLPAGVAATKKKGSKYDYYLSSGTKSRHNPLTSILRSLGTWGKRSWEKSIPAPYMYTSVEQRMELLRGLMDTDGYGNRNSAQFCSTSRALAEGVRELVMSLGGCAWVKTKANTRYFYKGKYRKGRAAYIVNLRLRSSSPMFWLARKLKKLGGRTKYHPTRSIADVVLVGKVKAQCIRVAAPDHLYVTDDYIVTHNTLTSIAAAEKLKGPTSVLVPAALQTNYQKELEKHIAGAPEAQYEVGSLQRAALHGAPSSKLQIVDEAHRLRDPSSATRKAVRDSGAEKRLLLTGTALYNKPYDLASLVNLAAGDNIFPGSQSDFDSRYLTEKVTDPGWFARNIRGVKPGSTTVLREKNKEELGKHLNQWVDFHENSTEGFPTRKDENVGTQLSPKQKQLYDFALKDAPAWVRYKIQRGLPPSKSESKDLNAFSGAVRQVSNSPGGFDQEMTPDEAAAHSPKIQEAYKRLAAGIAANPNHRALVYSNYLASGLTPYEALLQKNNIAYGKFTGEVGKDERDGMVRDYNEGKLKALLLSSAGGEGLDLKGTRQIQVLEPHWNKEKLEQVIARGIRYKSHEHLPEDQRSVNVEHYTSQMQEPGAIRKLFGAKRQGSIDEYLQMMSNEKDQLNQQVRGLLTRNQPAQKTAMLALVEEHQELLESCGSVG